VVSAALIHPTTASDRRVVIEIGIAIAIEIEIVHEKFDADLDFDPDLDFISMSILSGQE
jgi:hypothetical protein